MQVKVSLLFCTVIEMCLLVVYFYICDCTDKATRACCKNLPVVLYSVLTLEMVRQKDILWLVAPLRNTSSALPAVVLSRSNKQLLPNQPSHLPLLSFLYICTQYRVDSLWLIFVKGMFCCAVLVLHRTWWNTTSSTPWRRVSAVLTPLCRSPIRNRPMEPCPEPFPSLAMVSLLQPVQIRSSYSWK